MSRFPSPFGCRHSLFGHPIPAEGLGPPHGRLTWARCGRTDPIATETLRDLWPSYLRASAVRAQVAIALVNKGVRLYRSKEAIAVYDEVVAQFGDAPEPTLREQVANALVNKGVGVGRTTLYDHLDLPPLDGIPREPADDKPGDSRRVA
jgi:hypothetical protein